MEFSKEKTPTQSKIFSKRLFFVLFFLLFLVVTFFPAHNAIAQQKEPGFWQKVNNFAQSGSTKTPPDELCSIVLGDGVKCLILPIFKLTRILLEAAITLFTWIIDTDNIKTVLGSDALFEIWAFVRDLLNMAFILMLLFSAFCTIFQIEQYNYKKMLWKIVLMALLVNFSFPITRFIIDVSNILMYSLMNGHLFKTGDIQNGFAYVAKDSTLGNLFYYTSTNYPTAASLLAATVMLFMLAITFLAIGTLLLIRLIVLAILIIFSPIAFVGTILPGISSYASKWWDNLFKYSFFGPIMILGVIISVKLMASIGPALGAAAEKAAATNTDAPTFIGTIVLVSVPIVLLWTVMGVAQSMSIAGAGAVMGAAQRTIRSGPSKLAKWGLKKSGISGGIKKGYADVRKSGKIFGFDNKFTQAVFKDNQAEREAQLAGGISGGKTGWQKAVKDKKAEEFRKKYKEESEKYDPTAATGVAGLIDEILMANLHDPTTRNKDSIKVAAILHNLKTDSSKKDEFELKIREEAMKTTGPGSYASKKTNAARELYVKKSIADTWKVFNDKARQASEVASTGSASSTTVYDDTYATSKGVTNKLWT